MEHTEAAVINATALERNAELAAAKETIAGLGGQNATLLKACRRAVVSLAHAAIHHPEYSEDYEFVHAAIDSVLERRDG